ncbi:membrane protein insertion efficiency factor YidD [Caldovatus aquaticus]|uniref:Putative membrane protein insertion efficiency factor n=1 Tax=Caldovatus aquaticus TaxID=2865671 RepID=A0ABS7F7K6_9PROT|nr:membrane protein insertion efficiency factor YidD [Caldovatus aquaticus]MBW8271493.1 membrane protein insertion efficiency factor YidD [Caldovatus aquaticus]
MSAARPAPGLPARLLRGAVRTYQYALRPLIGANCRFHPHCSDYALEALAVHGALRGSLLAARRILRCNPWHPGGWDPVPPRTAAPAADPSSPKG